MSDLIHVRYVEKIIRDTIKQMVSDGDLRIEIGIDEEETKKYKVTQIIQIIVSGGKGKEVAE